MWLFRSSQFQRQESGLAPYSKRVLFVCERNLVESVMAEVDLYFFLLVAANKRGEKSTNLNWKKWNLNLCYICDMSALHFLIFVTKCAVQKISSWQPSCPWFFFRQYSTTWVLIWPEDGRETLLVQRWSFFPSSCICLGALNFCCNQISDFFCLIFIISCYLGEAWRGATWQQNCTNTKGSLFICSIYRICESSNCDDTVGLTRFYWILSSNPAIFVEISTRITEFEERIQ